MLLVCFEKLIVIKAGPRIRASELAAISVAVRSSPRDAVILTSNIPLLLFPNVVLCRTFLDSSFSVRPLHLTAGKLAYFKRLLP